MRRNSFQRTKLGEGHSWRGFFLCVAMSWLCCATLLLVGCPAPEEEEPVPVVTEPEEYLGTPTVEVFAPLISPSSGMYDELVEVVIALPESAEGDIFYTVDGAVPKAGEGDRYTAPLLLLPGPDKPAVTVRAVAVVEDESSQVVNQTYILRESVLAQSAAPQGFPFEWGVEDTADADYEMDARVWASSALMDEGMDALEQLPSVVVNIHPQDLFEGPWGIYANPEESGSSWERPAVLEWIDGDTSFSINCGIRVQGGTSTENWKSPKLSFRLDFQEEYGPSKLEGSLFDSSPVSQFDHLILDAGLNLTWIHPWSWERDQSQYIRDIFVAEVQRAMGWPAPHGRFVNLFLNGLYWGLYWIHEFPDASFARDHLGGKKKDWDVLKHDGSTVVHGNDESWRQMMDIVRGGVADAEGQEALEGFLDLEGFADYLLLNFFLGNMDWPHHNWYAVRKDDASGRFLFLSWDAEMVMHKLHYNRIEEATHEDTPGEIFQALRNNSEFRLFFADRVQHHLFGEGVFAPGAQADAQGEAVQIYMALVEAVRAPLLLESARWGDYRREDAPYTRDGEWEDELAWLKDTYFPQRRGVFLNHLREADLYPHVEAPRWAVEGEEEGVIHASLLGEWEEDEVVLVTTDGEDPRVPWTGDVAPGAFEYTDSLSWEPGMVLRARVLSGAEWSAEVRYPRWVSPWGESAP